MGNLIEQMQDNGKKNKMCIPGIILVFISIVCVIAAIYLSFSGDGFYENLSNTSIKSSVSLGVYSTIAIITGVEIKNKFPIYYKYQIASGSILLAAVLFLDIIPRIL